MKKILKRGLVSIIALIIFTAIIVAPAQAESPIIHAVLFYSPTCPHCHKVITEDLSVLQDEYKDQLLIITINIQTEEGNQLFSDALDYFGIPHEYAGVPLLIVGEKYLFGSFEIPDMFPGIIKEGLANGGISWTEIPSLVEVLRSEGLYEKEIALVQEGEEVEETSENTTQVVEISPDLGDFVFEVPDLSPRELFDQDPIANSISVVVLVAMVIVLVCSAMLFGMNFKGIAPWPKAIFVAFLVVGFIVAFYLSFVEMSQSEAVCGPVGDCNAVQQSPYAYLFGFIPIGVLGLLGYIMIGLTWLVANFGPEKYRGKGYLLLIALTGAGTVFSIYLTYLEPFVIGATCAWCLTSAIVITALLWQSSISYVHTKA